MRGISEERLLEIKAEFKQIAENNDCVNHDCVRISELINECKELNPRLPIDENTPKDRELLFKDKRGYKLLGQYNYISNQYKNDCGYTIYPTHYQELS